jgi:hypothetical protein
MQKTILAILFLLPLTAFAECGFTRSDNTMTIVVGSKSNKCFSSESFREAFKADLVAAVKAMDEDEVATAAQRRPIDQRSRSGQRLWQLEERLHQATMPPARYYGQRR